MTSTQNPTPLVLIDADACPVKDEAIDIALRHETPIIFIANQGLRLPRHDLIRREIVSDGFDAADNAIVDQAHALARAWGWYKGAQGQGDLDQSQASKLIR